MKKILSFILIFSLIFSFTLVLAPNAQVYAATESFHSGKYQIDITGESVSKKDGNLTITGSKPVVSSLSDSGFQLRVNNKIDAVYSEKIQYAKKDDALEISFKYGVKIDDSNTYILIYTTTTFGSARKEIDTVNFNVKTNEMTTLQDVMGVNAIPLANKYISKLIKEDPDKYNSDFKEINNSQPFYMEGDNCVLLFDEYQIAPGHMGVVSISMDTSNIHNHVVYNNQYVTKSAYNTKMIPLRTTCEALGYKVTWDDKTKSTIISKGEFSTKVTVDKNKYSTGSSVRELEAAPQNIKGTTYVPISFFDVILGACYSIDDNGNITFSQY